MKTLKKLKNKKGFTLIELLTVIAILGILVLIAAPKFLGYTAKANVSHIKADVKTYETRLAVDELENKDLSKDWTIVAPEDVDKYISEKSLYDEYGLVTDPEKVEGEVKLLDKKDVDVKTNLKGDFLYANGEVYYHDETLTMGNDKNDSVNDNDKDDNTVVDNNDKDDNTGVDEPEFTSENNFTWIANSAGYVTKEHPKELGYYQYTGTGEEIVNIPHVIKETEMTSYFGMFMRTGKDVKKVISTNPKVTDMTYMFYESQATTLDLSSFDTSNVTGMQYMFQDSQATTLDVSKFDTSKVTDMTRMFQKSKATTLDLSNFNTSNVTDMTRMFALSQATTLDLRSFNTSNVYDMKYMFYFSQATTLDLSNFDTSKVYDMKYMFNLSKATTLDLSSFDTSKGPDMRDMFTSSQAKTGYSRTQADADRFNASSFKPSNLIFRTK